MELCIDRVSKHYKNKIAVDRMSFDLEKGVTGLLGSNGAGKTTLMKMICGILVPDNGEITYDGMPVSDEKFRNILGYLPQEFGYYPEFSAKDFLMYFAALKGIEKNRAKVKADELLELTGLSDVSNKKIKTYSGGMKQRVGIAQALLNDPKVLIVDEPTSGLDPIERAKFRELIAKIAQENIVLLSTHIVSDLEHIADRLLIMQAGRLIWHGNWDNKSEDMESFYLNLLKREDKFI